MPNIILMARTTVPPVSDTLVKYLPGGVLHEPKDTIYFEASKCTTMNRISPVTKIQVPAIIFFIKIPL